MTWEEAGQLCFDQLPLIAKKLPLTYWGNQPEWTERAHFLFAEHARLKSKTEKAMCQFSTNQTWPALPTGSENLFACLRLLCAVDTTNILLCADEKHRLVPDPVAFGSTAVLNWLLIETWEWKWEAFLKLEALRSLSGTDSFYGLPPLPPKGN